jgi:hypothetical protein
MSTFNKRYNTKDIKKSEDYKNSGIINNRDRERRAHEMLHRESLNMYSNITYNNVTSQKGLILRPSVG